MENSSNENDPLNSENNVAAKPNEKPKKKRSGIWQHFSDIFVETENGQEEYAKCNYCIA